MGFGGKKSPRFLDDVAGALRHRQIRQLGHGNKTGVARVASRLWRPIAGATKISGEHEMQHDGVGLVAIDDVVDAGQSDDVRRQPGFLADLPARRFLGGLAGFDAPAGEAP